MLIANPIYDTFFKYMISKQEVATYIIENLLEVKLIKISPVEQEKVVFSAKELKIIRFDYACTIQLNDANKTEKNVIIELQKSENKLDIGRFRNYLAKNYKTKTANSNGEKVYLPIVAIYFLGFNLSHEEAFIKVDSRLIDLETKDFISEDTPKDKFISSLGHDLYIVQIPKINVEKDSHLHKVFHMFDQHYAINKDDENDKDEQSKKNQTRYKEGVLDIPDNFIPENAKNITLYLHNVLENEEVMDNFEEGLRLDELIKKDEKIKFNEGKNQGLKEGMEKGMEKGIIEANLKNAKEMKLAGIDTNLIAKITNLSVDQITSL
jgi:hypothetical protein